jgi:predicted dienelactone hydrolase
MRLKLGWKGVAAIAVVSAVAVAGLIVYAGWLADFADANLRVALPNDLALTPPANDVAPEIAAFAGIWGGDRWNGGPVPHALAVERVGADGSASVVYAWGADQERHRLHGWLRLKGRIAGGHLGFILPDGNIVDYAVAADGRLLGRSTAPSELRSYTLLKRIEASNLAAATRLAAKRAGPLWQDIRIPERAQIGDAAGSTLNLQATLYRTDRAGPQPVLILNPGSDDRREPEATLRYEEQARFFLSLGYAVVVPMRKGRGDSGGPLIEARNFAGPPPSSVQIESGIEDIDAVVEFMKNQSYIDSRRIVLAGRQHGGLLAVAYAGRHPGKVAAVVNFAGGWWPEEYHAGAIDSDIFAAAGRTATAPMLWLYPQDDPLWSLPHVERNFAAFRAGGGTGRLVVFPDPGIPKMFGTQLFEWTSKWEEVVADFLADAPAPAPGAGFVLFDLKDPLGSGAMPTAIFYPSAAPRTSVSRAIDAVNHAPLAEGRFPVILLSPGYGGDRLSHHDSAAALARAGFIVAAVTHPGEDPDDAGGWRSDRALIGREHDLRAALDAVLADPALGPHANRDRIGVAGAGLGGYDALLLAGAMPDFASGKGLPAIRSGLAVFHDARIKAAFLMAPEPGAFFDGDSLRAVTIPVRIYRAMSDRRPSSADDAEHIRALLPTPPEYVEVADARGEIFLAPCSAGQRRDSPQSCIDSPKVDRRAFHVRLNAEMVAFFRRALEVP